MNKSVNQFTYVEGDQCVWPRAEVCNGGLSAFWRVRRA